MLKYELLPLLTIASVDSKLTDFFAQRAWLGAASLIFQKDGLQKSSVFKKKPKQALFSFQNTFSAENFLEKILSTYTRVQKSTYS